MRDVVLHGWLAREFGAAHRFEIASPLEAVAALSANRPGFLGSIRAWPYGFAFFCADECIPEHELALPFLPGSAEQPLHMVPCTSGGFIFAPLIASVAGGLTSMGVVAGLAAGIATVAVNVVGGIALSLAIGGIMQLISPAPEDRTGKAKEMRSYDFDGDIEVTQAGSAVPIGYGQMMVPGIIISAHAEIALEKPE